MGAEQKKGVDWFPHYTDASTSSSTLFSLEQDYGNDGYAVWYKLLEFLGKQKELYIDKKERGLWKHFVSVCRIEEEKLINIINELAEMGAIDEELWTKHNVIWSDNFAENLIPVYKRRTMPIPTKPVFDSNPACKNTLDSKIESQTVADLKPVVTSTTDTSRLQEFCERFNVTIDNYNSNIYDVDFGKLIDAFDKSREFLQQKKVARYLSWVVKNYSSIIAGKYDDDPDRKTGINKTIEERQKQTDMLAGMYAKFKEEEDNDET